MLRKIEVPVANYSIPISTIGFSSEHMDYMIDGEVLTAKILRHEGMPTGRPSVACNPGSTRRLLLKAKPDLKNDWTALYLCDHCWGYDGQIVGCIISYDQEEESVTWSQIGYFDELEDDWFPFAKIKAFKFNRRDYVDAIEAADRLKLYESSG